MRSEEELRQKLKGLIERKFDVWNREVTSDKCPAFAIKLLRDEALKQVTRADEGIATIRWLLGDDAAVPAWEPQRKCSFCLRAGSKIYNFKGEGVYYCEEHLPDNERYGKLESFDTDFMEVSKPKFSITKYKKAKKEWMEENANLLEI